MSKLIDLTGVKFGRWTVMNKTVNNKRNETMWHCACECGNEKDILGPNLKKGLTVSCGCIKKEGMKHGCASNTNRSAEYSTWAHMMQRCRNNKTIGYENYGGRGITVCDRWNEFELFLKDMGKRPSPAHSIDRINVNGNYEPNNCKWATSEEQSRNKRVRKTNKTGVTGVCWDQEKGKYMIRIGAVFVGYKKTINEAKAMREESEIKYWGKGSS